MNDSYEDKNCEYENRLNQLKEEMERTRIEISYRLDSGYSSLTEAYDFATVCYSWYDNTDSTDSTITVRKTGDRFLLTITDFDRWLRAEQFIKRTITKQIDFSARNLALYGLLCHDILTSAKYQYTGIHGYGNKNGGAVLGSDKAMIRSDFITITMLAVLSDWVDVPDIFVGISTEYIGYPEKTLKAVEPLRDVTPAAPLFEIRYRTNEETQSFSIVEINDGFLSVRRFEKGEETVEKGYYSYYTDKYPDFAELLNEWTNEWASVAYAAHGPIEISLGDQKFTFEKMDKRLIDLVDFFSPEPLDLPAPLLVDRHNSVYYKARSYVRVKAFEGSKDLQYLRICAWYRDYYDQEEKNLPQRYSIGKRAFADSAIRIIELVPAFFSYYGTGAMPDVHETSFENCYPKNVVILNGFAFIGDPQKSGNYSIRIASIANEEIKKKYPNKTEYIC